MVAAQPGRVCLIPVTYDQNFRYNFDWFTTCCYSFSFSSRASVRVDLKQQHHTSLSSRTCIQQSSSQLHQRNKSVALAVSQSVCLFVCLSVCLSDCLSVCLSVCQSVCLSVCLSIAHMSADRGWLQVLYDNEV